MTPAALSTRASIVAAALELFAKRGLGSVSLREIVLKSGQGNQSAIHYHFRDKRGLVTAVAEHVRGQFQPHLDAALAEVVAKEKSRTLTDEDLVRALVMPLVDLYHGNKNGRDAIRFVLTQASDGGDAGQAMLLREAASYLGEIERRLSRRLPKKSREKLWLQILLSLNTTIFGLTAMGVLKFSPFDGRAPLYKGRREESIRDFVHFVCHGVLGD